MLKLLPPLPLFCPCLCDCRDLLGGAAHRRELGLDLLVRFAGPLTQEAKEGPQSSSRGELRQQEWGGVRADPDFWQLLRSCLCDGELSNRKRAAHVLQLAVAQAPDGEHGCCR